MLLGGIAIAEGCRFFVTQAIYDVTSTLSLVSDYAHAAHSRGTPPAPLILTFSPCGNQKTLAFMKWLGISFPRWLENELRFSEDPLTTSLTLCERIFAEVWQFALDKRIPVGINVESVSISKAEVVASVELLGRLKRIMQHGPS
jgi:5,10-methylenetetrahydrofolate reductase